MKTVRPSDYDWLKLSHLSGSFLKINVSLKFCAEIPRAVLFSSFLDLFGSIPSATSWEIAALFQ